MIVMEIWTFKRLETPKLSTVYLIGAFCRKDQHRESQGTHSEDGEQSNIKILYRRTEGCPSEPVQTGSVGLGQQRNINTNS